MPDDEEYDYYYDYDDPIAYDIGLYIARTVYACETAGALLLFDSKQSLFSEVN